MPPDYSFTGIENANDILDESFLYPSTLENIDTAMFSFFNEKVNLSVTTSDGFKKVPLIWSQSERSAQIKGNPELRDENGSLIYPLMSLDRLSVDKDPAFKGGFQAHFPDGFGTKINNGFVSFRRIVQDKTNNFATADAGKPFIDGNGNRVVRDVNRPRNNNKVVYETVTTPIPVYLKVMYGLKIKTNYQQQMNELITPFVTRTGQINCFSIQNNGHRYEVFTQPDFAFTNNIKNFESDERIFETDIKFKVLGYLVGQGENNERPRYSRFENRVEVKIPREEVVLEIPNQFTKKSFYR
jgi:hypothetical protein